MHGRVSDDGGWLMDDGVLQQPSEFVKMIKALRKHNAERMNFVLNNLVSLYGSRLRRKKLMPYFYGNMRQVLVGMSSWNKGRTKDKISFATANTDFN